MNASEGACNIVGEMYDVTSKDYIEAWSNEKDLGCHLGFWDGTTKNRHESIRNTNGLVARVSKIQENDTVLDAGCGIGGTSIFIAKECKARVVGITLSKVQVQLASMYARKMNATGATFLIKDFTRTGFDDESFDHVVALESTCHANTREFILESYRVLKKGGTLLAASYAVNTGERLSWIDKVLFRTFIHGWRLAPMIKDASITRHAARAGFSTCTLLDVTPSILPSSAQLSLMCSVVLLPDVLNAVTRKRHAIVEMWNTIGSVVQYYLFRRKKMKYYMMLARK